MKFLYLKGMDISGPFEAEQLAKEACFSADLLVCPEDKAEQEAAWKPASRYEEFKSYLEQKPLHIEETEQIVNRDLVADFKILDSEKDKDISQELPPLEDTNTETSTTELDSFSFEKDMNNLSSQKQEDNTDDTEEDIKDHTFHIANKEDNLLEDLPAHSLLGEDEEQEPSSSEAASSDKKDNEPKEYVPFDKKGVENVKEIDNRQNGKDFLEISNNKIISSSDGRVKKRSSNDLIFILSFIVLMVVAIALCMAFWNIMSDEKEQPEADVTVSEEVSQADENEVDKLLAQENFKQEEPEKEAIPNQAAAPSVAGPSEEQVINIVKNTRLTGKKENIGDYLTKIYGKDYQSSWSAKPFTDKVYIVEFFASQVRSEPFVYLFRVDIDQKKITGALNNITLDLLA
ncbi:MAG: hypothetical protein II183_02245 [Elusimicrobiaceae bacterium]|nr:hypothetical protein [Elusimicrobiaceae bacterium]